MSKFHQGKLSPDQGKFREKSGNLIFKIVWPPCITFFLGGWGGGVGVGMEIWRVSDKRTNMLPAIYARALVFSSTARSA